MKKIFFMLIAAFALTSCGNHENTISRPTPPTFVADGNKPSPDVAVDFMLRYSAAAQAAVERTPYEIKDHSKQVQTAQRLFDEDGKYLLQWVEAGDNLFTAAGIQTCKLFVASVFQAWKIAYPLNGPVSESEMSKKREIAKYSQEQAESCKHHLSLPSYGK